MKLEICLDNYESLKIAANHGADRIELCASLKEGGLTPPLSFIEAALKVGPTIFVNIRPRSCDFLYTGDELEMMHSDIHTAKKAGAPGVVFGVLTESGEIDVPAMKSLMKAAQGLDVTFHRAVDQVRDVYAAIDTCVELGVTRILSSGQKKSAYEGIETLAKMVQYANRRVMIMAAAGLNPSNVREIIERTRVDEVHGSAATFRRSHMKCIIDEAKVGDGDDFSLKITDGEAVRQLKAAITTFQH